MEKTSIELRVAKISVASWVGTGVTLIIQLISVPVCLHFWGKNIYGTWLAVIAAFTLLRTIDYGYTLFVGNKLNILYNSDDNALRITLASAIWGVLILGLLQLAVLVFLYYYNSMNLIMHGMGNSQKYNFEVFLALLIMSICWISTASYIGIVHRILNPLGLLYQSTWMMMIFQGLQFFALITAAILNFTILKTAILFSTVQAMFYILSAIYVKSLLPQYYPWWKNSNPKIGTMNIFCSIPLTLGWMMTQGGSSALIILVSALLGPATIPVFTALMTIGNLWTTLINSFTQPLIPEIVRFYAKKEWSKLIYLNKIHWILMGTLINLSMLIAYPFLGLVFRLWTGHHLYFDKPLLSLLLAATVASGMSALMGTFISGVNDYGYTMTSSAISGLLVLLMGWILLPFYGITGLGWAMLIAEVLLLFVTNLWFYYKILAKIKSRITLSFLGWSWLSALSVIIYFITQCYTTESVNLMYWVTLSIVLLSMLSSWHGLDNTIKTRIRSLLWRLAGRI